MGLKKVCRQNVTPLAVLCQRLVSMVQEECDTGV